MVAKKGNSKESELMDTLGVVECRSIAAGVEVSDMMVKVAAVELIRASAICSGRYLIYISGDRMAVSTAVQQAKDSGRALRGSFVISSVSPQLMAVLHRERVLFQDGALAVVECKCVSAGIAAADVAVKRSDVSLIRFVAGQGINGKSYFVLGGDVASVNEATQAAQADLGNNLVEAVVIPRPDASVVKSLLKRG